MKTIGNERLLQNCVLVIIKLHHSTPKFLIIMSFQKKSMEWYWFISAEYLALCIQGVYLELRKYVTVSTELFFNFKKQHTKMWKSKVQLLWSWHNLSFQASYSSSSNITYASHPIATYITILVLYQWCQWCCLI